MRVSIDIGTVAEGEGAGDVESAVSADVHFVATGHVDAAGGEH